MVNYNNGKIYKLECLTTGLIYVGSTTKHYLSQRLVNHRQDYEKYINGKCRYITSFKILENDNYSISLLESVNCNTKDELLAREGYYIKTLDCVNKKVMGRTRKEYHQDNKERLNEISRKYREDNLAVLLEKSKQYRLKNIDTLKEKKLQKHTCECGGKYSHCQKVRHLNTIKHQTFFNKQN